MIHRTQ